ncbi:MAG: metal-dependent transcriptional regulator [Solirubrobacterales bacterium]
MRAQKQAPAAGHTRPRSPAPTSEAVEDYAKAIYALAHRSGGPVGTSELAERLAVTPATATAMLKRLADRGLVRYQPYKGATLTPEGERVALEVIRHHRLIEAFLAEALEMPWDRVHAEAEVLEHHISEDLEARIAARLGEPTHDPHGDPIPGPDLEPPSEAETRPLAELGPGEAGVFSRVSDSDPAMLRYLSERGLGPGVEFLVTGRQPFQGPLLVEVGGVEHALGHELVRRIRVSEARR